jgi:hypothetical protein
MARTPLTGKLVDTTFIFCNTIHGTSILDRHGLTWLHPNRGVNLYCVFAGHLVGDWIVSFSVFLFFLEWDDEIDFYVTD